MNTIMIMIAIISALAGVSQTGPVLSVWGANCREAVMTGRLPPVGEVSRACCQASASSVGAILSASAPVSFRREK